MPTPVDLQLGRLAVQRGLTTEERVRECLELQRRNRAIGYDEPLSAVLAKRGFIGEPERRTLEDELALYQFLRGEQLFARRCVERGLFDRDAARALLAELRAGGHGTRVGDLLVERGTIDRATRDAIAREVFSVQDEEERAAREADARAVGGAPPPPPPPPDEGTGEVPLANVQPKALASFGRDQRRFSSSGEWVEAALPTVEGFEVEQRLGQGPNGVVYRARVVATNERVALKVLSPALVGAPGFVAAIKRAWALAQRVDHAAFVRLGAPGRTSELIFYTMDLIDGDSLRTTIERSGPLASERLLALLRTLLAGLERAHQVGAVHGALSPENVLLSRATGWPVVTDLPLSGVGRVGQGVTGLYASPQRLTGATQPTPSDDVYSLGCVAYYAALGKPPFAEANATLRLASGVADPRDLDPALDSRLATFIERSIRPEPGDRLDVAQALALLDATRAPRAPQPPQPPKPPQVPRAPVRPVPPRPDALPPPSGAQGDNDRTLLMPAVLPLPASAGAAQAAAAAAKVDEGIERTMELAPPPGLFVPPVEEALDQTIVTPPPTPQDEPIERTMFMTAPPSYPPPPPADAGSELDRTLAVGPPTGWSDLLRKDSISSSNSSTQPLPAATVPPTGVLASTLEDSSLPLPPPPPPGERGPTSSAFVRPARPGEQPSARQAAAAAIAENDPHFNAMGETMPMRPLGASQDDLTGRLIHNRYRIVGKLGQGGMGVVYKAEHTLMGRTVAFKVLNPELVKNAESIARFKREVMAMAQFQHRNVVRIFDAGATEDGRFYMAMELVDGVSLADVLKQGPMPLDRFVRVMAQILRGVAEGHKRGIVHRDLKSENILLTTEGGDELVKIMDFGIAKVLWAQEAPQSQSNAFLTTERMAVGTPEYMSPEQASGGAKIDARSDIYSLGVVGYELVTGRLPFDADSPVGYIGKHIVDPPITFAERVPHLHLPPSLEQMIMRALEKDPESRFPSAEAMLVGLEQALPEHAGALRAVAGGDARGSRSASPSPLPTTPPTKVLGPPLGSDLVRRGGPTGSAAARGPGKTPLESSQLASVETSGETSGEGAPSPGGGGVLVKRLLLALAGVATLLLATIVVLVVVRRPSSPGGGAAVAGALDADRQQRVDAALNARDFDGARRLLEEVRPEDAADPARASVDEQLKRVADAEDASTKLAAVATELQASVDALRRASAAEDLPQVEAALAKLRPLPAEGARLHGALTSLGLAGLAGSAPPGADVAALEAQLVAPLRELEDAMKMAKGLLGATPPEYDSALSKLELALARTKLPARREELEALRRQAKHDQLVSLARRELDRQPPNYQRAIDLLQQAYASSPSDATKDLLDRAAARAAEDSRGSSERQVADLVRRAEEALSRGDVDVAERELERARRLQQDQRLQDTWDFPARLTAVKAEKTSRAAHAALPAVTEQSAAAELEFALARRRAYVQEHPQGYKRAEVEAECAALEARLEALRGGAPRRSFERLLASAREAFERRAWDEARSLAREAAEAARGGDLDPAPALALDAQIDARELQVQALERDFVQVGPQLRFCRYEVTVREYFAFCHRRMLRAKESGSPADVERVRALWLADWTPTRDRPDVPSFPTGTSQNPAGGVSFRDAEEYCAWRSEELGLKVRLPTEAEWQEAATKGQKQSYPWGDAWDPARVAYRRMNDGPVSVVTSLEGQSPFDLRHMAGNVAEWVDTVWEDPAEGPDPSSRVLKGGSFRSMAPENLTVTSRLRGGVTERKSEWGFRVVVEVGP